MRYRYKAEKKLSKFAIDAWHNVFPDIGAVGVKKEDDLTLALAELIISRLTCLGHECVRTLPNLVTSVNASLRQRAFIANANDVDVVCSIHFNASASKQGRGTETFYISNSGHKLARSVNDEIVKLGFRDRGPKYGTWYILRHTKAPAILVEVAFCDNAGDMQLLDDVGLEAIANAIVVGLIS